MNRKVCLATIVCSLITASALADYTVEDKGTWPATWPEELEPLRERASTLEGPLVPYLHYAIPFAKREEFETAWPHLLKVKSTGAPIILRRAPSFWLGKEARAGICIHTPPAGQPARSAVGNGAAMDWQKSIYIELIVDGDIVDLNRIPLPPETPIIDERFPQPDGK